MPSKQAEAITAAITEVLNDSLENVAHCFVSKAGMQKVVILFEFDIKLLKCLIFLLLFTVNFDAYFNFWNFCRVK